MASTACVSFRFFTDIDECTLARVTGLQACHGDTECRNSHGSFICSCPSGYILAVNGQSCVGEAGSVVCMTVKSVSEAFYVPCIPEGSSEG